MRCSAQPPSLNWRRVSKARMVSSKTLLRRASTEETSFAISGMSRMVPLMNGYMISTANAKISR